MVKAYYVDRVFHETVINFDRYFSVTKLEGKNDKEQFGRRSLPREGKTLSF